MTSIVLLLLLLGLCQGQMTDSSDDESEKVDDLINNIFGMPSPTENVIKESHDSSDDESKTIDDLINDIYETPSPTENVIKESHDDDIGEEENRCELANGERGICVIAKVCSKKGGDNTVCSKPNKICCSPQDVDVPFNPTTKPTVQNTGCGWRNDEETRILSDSETHFAEFPWIVAILSLKAETSDKTMILYLGGGSIIHPRAVLTAAHKVYEDNISLRVRAGEWNIKTNDEDLPHQEQDVGNIIIHEQFNRKRLNLRYNVAILVLNRPLQLAYNVQPICLPPPGQIVTSGTNCLSAGWGRIKFAIGNFQDIPKKVELPVVDKAECQRILRKTRLGLGFKLHNTLMCAGGVPGKDTCDGDGGSPLMCPITGQRNRYMASGLVSWGLGCGASNPAAYADVSVLRDWIDAKMKELGFGIDSYTFE